MARHLQSSGPDILQVDATPITAAPLTINFWGWPDTTNGFRQGVSIANSGSGHYFSVGIGSSGNKAQVNASGTEGTSFLNNVSNAIIVADTWFMITGVFASASSRTIYTNAGTSDNVGTTITPTGLNRITVGRLGDSTPSNNWNGYIAGVALWSVALSAGEVDDLYAGGIEKEPWLVRPDGLKVYYPFFDADGDINWIGDSTYDLSTANGTPTYADHISKSMWLPPTSVLFPSAAAGPTVVAVGIASETDAALAVAVAPKRRLVTSASETDAGLVVTPVQTGPQIISVGIATETDTALAVDIDPFRRLVGIASEADAGLAITVSQAKIVSVGIATETDTALAVDIDPFRRLVGIATETDAALAVGVVVPQEIAVGIASETDAGLVVTPVQVGPTVIAVGISTETDDALAVAASGGVVQAEETIFNIPAASRSYYTVNLEA